MAHEQEGLTIEQLAQALTVTRRAIRFWVQRGVLPKPGFRGRGTRYSPSSVARIHAMRALQRQGLTLSEIRHRLDNATPDEIERLAASVAPAPAAPEPEPIAALHAEQWQRLLLLPGLELHLRRGSPAVIVDIANQIARHYAASFPTQAS